MLSCLIALLALAQTPAPDSAGAAKPYVIRLKDGSELAGFWQEKKELGNGFVEVTLDTPWAPGKKRLRLDDLKEEPIRELPNATQDRRKRALETAGLVEIDGAYVAAAEVRLAERARQMAGIRNKDDKPPPTAPGQLAAPAETPTEEDTTRQPSLVAQWGGQAALALVAVILLAVIIRKCFLTA